MLTNHQSKNSVRICAAVSTTQLLPLIHILRHQPEVNCQDILLWDTSCMGAAAEEGAKLMQAVAESYPFAAIYRLENFKIPTQRTAGVIGWPLQFLLRHKHDSQKLKKLLLAHLKDSPKVEIWTDEPIHFPMMFLHGMFPTATHVKIPHGFDLELSANKFDRAARLEQRKLLTTIPRRILWKINKLISGISYDTETGLIFDRAYTFNRPSSWSDSSVDMSQTITLENMKEIYSSLSQYLRSEIEAKIQSVSSPQKKPWILLLLFPISSLESKEIYRNAINRIFQEKSELFSGHQLVIKPHPIGSTKLPLELVEELSRDLPIEVSFFNCRLNLDILWHLIPADIVLAGPCGALPIVSRLGVARSLVINEILEDSFNFFSEESVEFKQFKEMMEGLDVV